MSKPKVRGFRRLNSSPDISGVAAGFKSQVPEEAEKLKEAESPIGVSPVTEAVLASSVADKGSLLEEERSNCSSENEHFQTSALVEPFTPGTPDKPRTNLGQTQDILQSGVFQTQGDLVFPQTTAPGEASNSQQDELLSEEASGAAPLEELTERKSASADVNSQESKPKPLILPSEGAVAQQPSPTASKDHRSILGQTQDKPRTNIPSKLKTNLGQSQDDSRTNLGQQKQTSDKPKTELRTHPRTYLGQTSDKPRAIIGFHALSGLQREITVLIYENCLARGERVTGPLSIEHLSSQLKTTRLSVQKSVQRLEQKEIVTRVQFKAGRGGWTVYELPESVWNQIFQASTSDKLRTNLGQTPDKPKTEPRTEPRTNVPSSSSGSLSISNNNNELLVTTKPQASEDLPPEWQNIVADDTIRKIGFGKTQLLQLWRAGKLTPTQVQSSLDALSFDLRIKKRSFKTSPLNALMGILVKGNTYEPPEGYKSPEDLIFEENLKRRMARNEAQRAREALAFETLVDEWLRNLGRMDFHKIFPNSDAFRYEDRFKQHIAPRLKQHFRESVWPDERAKLFSLDAQHTIDH